MKFGGYVWIEYLCGNGNIMQERLVSRNRECDELQRCLESDRSEFVIISGRRRIGKTYLIDKFFNYKYDFTFVGEHNTPASVQIQNFMRAIRRHSKRRQPKAETWYDAFNALEDYLETLPSDRKKSYSLMKCLGWIRRGRILSMPWKHSGTAGATGVLTLCSSPQDRRHHGWRTR